MNCGGRIYKGEDISASIPFALSGYTNLSVSYFTNGEVSVERTEEQLVIDGGYIIADFDNTDLDILPDGVLRYTITCKVDGEDYVDSNNTPYYLKTPKDYDAKTAEEIWEEGYESGATSCSGSCEGVYEEGFADGHASGVTDGYAQGYPAGEAAQKAKLATTAITENGIYTKEDGYNRVEVAVPSDFPQGYASGYTDGHASGVTDGYAQGYPAGETAQKAKLATTAVTANGTYSREDGFSSIEVNVPSGGSCNLQSKSVSLTANSETITADTGYDGLSQVEVDASEIYTSGETAQKAKLSAITITQNGTYSREDGFDNISVNIPLVSSFQIIFVDENLISPENILSANVAGDFVIDSAYTQTSSQRTYVSVYGHPSGQMSRLEDISITIPRFIYETWNRLAVYSVCLNGTPGSMYNPAIMSGGIRFLPEDVYLNQITDTTAEISVELYDYS